MELQESLSTTLVGHHPEDAAAVLEAWPVRDAAQLLTALRPEAAAGVLARMAPAQAAALLGRLDSARASALVAALGLDRAAFLVRRLGAETRAALLEALPAERARPLGLLLRFPPGSAGGLMDPQVLALPEDLRAEQALARLRETPENALYNLYVLDRDQRLVGVMNLRELLLAPPEASLGAVMRTPVQHLRADTERHAIVAHAGWREVHSLPVVDEAGRFLGAIRYRTLRRVEEELRGAETAPGAPTAQALGDLFWTGVAGLLEAVAGAAAGPAPAARG